METTSDKVMAVAGSLGLHALVMLALYLGLLRQPELDASGDEGPAIEATLVSTPQQVAAAIRRIEAEPKPAEPVPPPPPQPKPEPAPQDAQQPQQPIPQARIPKPETVDQDEVRRAGELAAEKKQQEQDEKRRQAQLDLSRQQEQQEAENRQRALQQQLERDKQLAQIRKERAEADRQVKLQEQKLKQLADAAARSSTPSPAAAAATPAAAAGPPPESMSLRARYLTAIRAVVNQNWRHDGVPERTHCTVKFKQVPGGEVFEVGFGDCPFDANAKASVEDALKRTPLPYSGFESAFLREGTIDMCYPEEACK
jgi:colicin import membrane protein